MIGQSLSRLLTGYTLIALLPLTMCCGQLDAVDDDGKKDEEARRDEQLKKMTLSASRYVLTSTDDRKQRFKFHENAVMRFSNPVGASKDGTNFLWSDRGRPQAIVKIYTNDNNSFTHEWLSLSESTFVAERDGKVIWSPTEPGLAFRELPDAPKPAESAADRSRQMKTIAGKFSSTYTSKFLDAKPHELRLLTQPLLRYETNDDSRNDGALFAFAQSTAPIGLLLIETRKTQEGQRYYYAFVSMVIGPVTARYGEKEILNLEKDYSRRDPTLPYLQLHRQPVPKE
jgi:hypothetical protein